MSNFLWKTAVCLITIVLAGALIFAEVVWKAYVLVVMWGWFIAPTFDLPLISLPVGVGLFLTVALATHQRRPTSGSVDWIGVVYAFTGPVFLLAVGWVATQFM